mmetsp:Transcript_4121/g.4717  ORF Transcript_4121/g.4717 Transcript_4121/m.4717 type:complete len:277 (+) Transcript_4121:375-1205(+)|eukprot:CAMPEP_0197858814 /NCGR_PEP_ID=MMETSP1438-20131217/32890_1 /TAXON_ID=1461541 /ORGANISM="Pterosperma sp., Strain CCMP1384" /LENGTH=276 /DNA_ID=CAMNT_0043475085 /DNA_START=371 /DNA_END=1201 /DNA_ORIENTATION=-
MVEEGEDPRLAQGALSARNAENTSDQKVIYASVSVQKPMPPKERPRPSTSPLPTIGGTHRYSRDNGIPGGLPSLRARPVSWAQRQQQTLRTVVGQDELEKLKAMLDFKDRLVQEMASRNQVLLKEQSASQETINSLTEKVAGLEAQLAENQKNLHIAEAGWNSAETRMHMAIRERDNAFSSMMQAQAHAEAELSKQQVAWDMGKQHALHLIMNIKRQGGGVRAPPTPPRDVESRATHLSVSPTVPLEDGGSPHHQHPMPPQQAYTGSGHQVKPYPN